MLVTSPIIDDVAEVNRTFERAVAKARRRDETVLRVWKVLMPYHRIWIACSDIGTSKTEMVATALNAVFCVHAKHERELLQLFRPKHVDRPLIEEEPQHIDAVLPYQTVDLYALVARLIKIRADALRELTQVELHMVKAYRRMQWRYLFLPISTRSIERERQVSTKHAQLRSMSLAVDMCLNVKGAIVPEKVEEHDVFYAPMAVAVLGHRKKNSERFVLVDLTTGRADAALTILCETEDNFGSALKLALQESV